MADEAEMAKWMESGVKRGRQPANVGQGRGAECGARQAHPGRARRRALDSPITEHLLRDKGRFRVSNAVWACKGRATYHRQGAGHGDDDEREALGC